MSRFIKIGELAYITGATVRTLQYYDRIGLLKPARVTESGHRLYDERSVSEFYSIAALKQLGLSLSEIRMLKETTPVDLESLIDMQLIRLEEEIARRQALMRRLAEVRRRLAEKGRLTLDDFQEMLHFVEGLGTSFSPDTFERLKEVRDRLTRQPELVSGWSDFIEKLKACYTRNVDHTAPDARACVAYWRDLVAHTIGDNPQLQEVAFAFHASGRGERLNFGLSDELYRYLRRLDEAVPVTPVEPK